MQILFSNFSQHILRELRNESGLVMSLFLLHNPMKLSQDFLNVISLILSLIFTLSPSFPMQKSDLISHIPRHLQAIWSPNAFRFPSLIRIPALTGIPSWTRKTLFLHFSSFPCHLFQCT
ncbi:hypothetical protein RchiOBHm_Chr7g0221921 [Rosa chinensis]|uniref:Uncharacterized protein n=1 Tax=Rosa chinensis TaxID=74649 RepID=A0A2P6PD52_ROSCH|nr:hypothetical protein RchiOBHm_Chr7g0221921 [Rosa chinensis]